MHNIIKQVDFISSKPLHIQRLLSLGKSEIQLICCRQWSIYVYLYSFIACKYLRPCKSIRLINRSCSRFYVNCLRIYLHSFIGCQAWHLFQFNELSAIDKNPTNLRHSFKFHTHNSSLYNGVKYKIISQIQNLNLKTKTVAGLFSS